MLEIHPQINKQYPGGKGIRVGEIDFRVGCAMDTITPPLPSLSLRGKGGVQKSERGAPGLHENGKAAGIGFFRRDRDLDASQPPSTSPHRRASDWPRSRRENDDGQARARSSTLIGWHLFGSFFPFRQSPAPGRMPDTGLWRCGQPRRAFRMDFTSIFYFADTSPAAAPAGPIISCQWTDYRVLGCKSIATPPQRIATTLGKAQSLPS